MKRILTMVLILVLLAAAGTGSAAGTSGETSASNGQSIAKSGSQAAFSAPEQYFTGNVRVNMLFVPKKELPASGAYVTFEAGARSAWHTHPAGQTLVVTSGIGLTQEWGGPIVEIRPGDVVRCPPGIKHWHGASPGRAMTHMAITGEVNGKNVEWMEKVTDRQYHGR